MGSDAMMLARMEQVEEDRRIGEEALTRERLENSALKAEMARRDAFWMHRARATDAQVETLRHSLADAWASNAAQADEFVSSLFEVQQQLSRLETHAVPIDFSEATASALAPCRPPPA